MGKKCYFIATSWGDGAVPSHFRELGRSLVIRGHKVVFITWGQNKDLVSPESNPALLYFPSRRPVKVKDFFFLWNLVCRHHPNCLIANFGAVNVMMLVGFLLQVPVRISWYRTLTSAIDIDWQDSLVKKKFFRLRKKIVYQMGTHLVANSEATKKDLIDNFDVLSSKCSVFFNSLKDFKNKKDLKKIEHVILCVGRLDRSKGQDVLIKSIGSIKNKFPSTLVQFVGGGQFNDKLISLAKANGVTQNCQFLGPLPHSKVLEKMASAYVTVVPSRSEAFGLVVIEPMSMGTPVIGTQVGGIPELIRDGVDGFLIPPDDPTILAEKILYLLENPSVRDTMGQNARQRFLDTFEQSKIIAQQVEWLEELVEGK